jgi:hypothetical protein
MKFSGDLKIMALNKKEVKFSSNESDKRRENLENKIINLEKLHLEISSLKSEMKNSRFYKYGFKEVNGSNNYTNDSNTKTTNQTNYSN